MVRVADVGVDAVARLGDDDGLDECLALTPKVTIPQAAICTTNNYNLVAQTTWHPWPHKMQNMEYITNATHCHGRAVFDQDHKNSNSTRRQSTRRLKNHAG